MTGFQEDLTGFRLVNFSSLLNVGLRRSNLVIVLAFLFGIIGLGYFTEQSEFSRILMFGVPMFGAYFWLVFRPFDMPRVSDTFKVSDTFTHLTFWLTFAIFLRFLLLFAFPSLSDDVFRFIWDGRLWNAGVNPFEQLPTYYLLPGNQVHGLDSTLFNQLNSPEYFTIYPPVNQLIFYISTAIFSTNIWGSMFLMKCFLFACEVGTILLLPKVLIQLKIDVKNTLVYAINPLIIIELCGNLHFEAAMIFFLVLAVYLLLKKRVNWSAIAFALSVASKLLPLIFLPFLIKKIGWKKSIQYGMIVAISLVILYLPILTETFIQNFGNSLNLYFQKFEFNASIYYISRWIGYQKVGWNMIAEYGPKLAMVSFSTILLLAFLPLLRKNQVWGNLPAAWLWAITIYLLFTTTIHPWYVSLPLFLCCFTNFKFPVIWSGLIFLTYINYSYGAYFENLWVVFFEYLIVFSVMIFEIGRAYKKRIGNSLESN